jgi:uncharacterized Ntn-hydrolase superfamily protein
MDQSPISTFSVVACDSQAGEMVVAVASHYFAVGSVVPWAEVEVGSVSECLYATLKADDEAWGDARGSQSSGIVPVGKHRGRNINNDRPVWTHVASQSVGPHHGKKALEFDLEASGK